MSLLTAALSILALAAGVLCLALAVLYVVFWFWGKYGD